MLPSTEEEAYNNMIKAFEGISQELEFSQYLFTNQLDNKVTSITTVKVYVYIQEAMRLAKNSLAIKELNENKRYAVILEYMKWVEERKFRIDCPIIETSDILKISDKFLHKPMASFPLGMRLIQKSEYEQDSQSSSITKWVALGFCTLGLTILNFVPESTT